MDARTSDLVATHADMLQIGSRNMQNFTLLTKSGKREARAPQAGMWATVEQWLLAAEYILRRATLTLSSASAAS